MNQRKEIVHCKNKMRSTKLLKIREWSATQTHIHDRNLFNVRQDGDNVRHMHLIDLHLLKHLHHTHLLTHSLARSLGRSFAHSFVHHRTPIMSINTNTTNCYIEWWTIKRESCSHILHALYMRRARDMAFAVVIRCDTVTIQWQFCRATTYSYLSMTYESATAQTQ